MGLKEIEEGIKKSVEEEIKKIKNSAKIEIEKIKKENKRIAKKKYNEILERGKKECEIIKKRIIGNAKLNAREMIERKRGEILEKAFELAKKRILTADEKTKKALIEKFVKDGKKEIGNAEILIDKNYAHLFKKAKPINLGDFGIVILDKNKDITIDYTLKKMVSRLKERLEHKLVKIIWQK